MKMPKLILVLTGLFAGHADSSRAAVAFSLTPSSISNTYGSTVTLQVTGLAGGDTVLVQKYLDANTNGVVDGSDPLMQQFALTDGVASVFHDGATSVTNFNVPGDTDTTAGQITAKLYPGLDFTQLLVGKYLYVLSSPAGHFSPMTNSFAVTNFPFAQSITGTVVSNATPVPNAIVILFQPSGGGQNPQSGVVANNSGVYTIKVPTGTYMVAAVKSNYLANFSVVPNVTLGTGGTITTNVPVTTATQSISGNVIDMNNSSIGLAGFLVPVQSTNNLLGIAFTDTNGNYAARVTPSQWKISSNSRTLAYKGYVGMNNSIRVNSTTGSVAGVTMAVPKASAVCYGTVKDSLGNPLPGVGIGAYDNNGNYYMDGYSDANGDYVTAAVGGLSGDQWGVEFDQSGPANYIYSQGTNGFTLNTGQAYKYNFTGILAANQISGAITFNGSPVANCGVNANATINGVNFSVHADTDSNGNYSLNAANGMWSVSVNCCCGNDSLDALLGNGNYQCPNNQNAVINNNNGVANFAVQPAGGGSYQIYGYVMDNLGNPIAGVGLTADDGMGDVYPGTTDGTGYYAIPVSNGSWDVLVDCGELNSLGFQCVSDRQVGVSAGNIEEDFTVQPASGSGMIFGYGRNNLGDPVAGVNVHADDGQGNVYSGATDGTGYYSINVTNGSWYVSVDCGALNSLGYGCLGEDDVAIFGNNLEADFYAQPAASSAVPIILHSFSGAPNEGASLYDQLVLSGNVLYGTTYLGGNTNEGTIFKLNLDGTGFMVLYDFTARSGASLTNSDGAYPYAGLILSNGVLYGTASAGGSSGFGTVFKVNTDGTGFATLHSFNGGSDGAEPWAGLVLSGATLYGAAGSGGNGTLFKVNTDGTGFAVLHSFSGVDGAYPIAGLVLSGGTLYGTTWQGGSSGNGVAFAINTDGTGFSILHDFTATLGALGTNGDGAQPQAALVLSGNTLYGTSVYGGAYGDGTVFEINTNGSGFTTLHGFAANYGAFPNGSAGANPNSVLILRGNTLYGTTTEYGGFGSGTVFAINTDGTGFVTLSDLAGSGADAPLAGLVLSGNALYGTTLGGGSSFDGTVFSLPLSVPPALPVLSLPLKTSASRFQFLINGVSNQNYTIQMSTNLVSTNWTSLFITNNAQSNSFLVVDPNATNRQRYYRVLIGP